MTIEIYNNTIIIISTLIDRHSLDTLIAVASDERVSIATICALDDGEKVQTCNWSLVDVSSKLVELTIAEGGATFDRPHRQKKVFARLNLQSFEFDGCLHLKFCVSASPNSLECHATVEFKFDATIICC